MSNVVAAQAAVSFDSPYPRQLADFVASLHTPCLRASEVIRQTLLSNTTLQNWVREGGDFFAEAEQTDGRSRRFTPFMMLMLDIRARLPLAAAHREMAHETSAEIAKALEPKLRSLPQSLATFSSIILTGNWDDDRDSFDFKLHEAERGGFPDIEALLTAAPWGTPPMIVWLLGRHVLELMSETRLTNSDDEKSEYLEDTAGN